MLLVHAFVKADSITATVFYKVSVQSIFKSFRWSKTVLHRLLLGKGNSITSTICDELHWLHIVKRIHFKQCMLVYRSVDGIAPSYIADMCVKRSFESAHYNLRSSVRSKLVVPIARKSALGIRSFKYSGLSLLNALPHDIRDSCITFSQFRSRLKTLLYRVAYYP